MGESPITQAKVLAYALLGESHLTWDGDLYINTESSVKLALIFCRDDFTEYILLLNNLMFIKSARDDVIFSCLT